jgi:beta-lactamase class A
MSIGRGRIASIAIATLALFAAPLPAQTLQSPAAEFPSATVDRALEAQLRSIVANSGGRIGIYAADIDGSRLATINADQAFPMASTVKVAIAAAYLQGVDEGRLRLDASYPLRIGTGQTGPDGRVITREGMSLTAQSLIELMITKSDNQATDAILSAVGGPGAVNRWLLASGISGLRVDRDIATLLRDDLEKNDASLGLDKRDTSTPAAMVRLLRALHRGEVLTPRSRAVLLGAMSRCLTGKTRIPALLPAGTLVAHKTGTLYSQTSDVGIIRLPDGRSVALAVFVTGKGSHSAQAQTIAQVARTVYDGFTTSGYQPVYSAHR